MGQLGDEDSLSSAAIFPDEPGVPGTPAVDVTGVGTATVTWTAPTTGGPVTSYVLTSNDPDAVIPGTCGDDPGHPVVCHHGSGFGVGVDVPGQGGR